MAYNNAIGIIPAVLFAGMLGFKSESMYEVSESKKQDVDMKQLLKAKRKHAERDRTPIFAKKINKQGANSGMVGIHLWR
ncbi:hypothetical protein [Paenibacillus sp. YYML68]|uniref:hypothetical protein n=1 Tax=Paenibacillus sp. YYML68 TaxID=2909250 RepID=UPI0037C71460